MNRGREVPLGINATVGAVAVVLLCAVPSSVTGPEIDARLAVIAVGLAGFAVAVVDVAAIAISVGIAFVLFDGFVEGDHGDLAWHGRPDLIRLGVLCLAAVAGLLIGAWRQRVERTAARRAAPSVSRIPNPRTPDGSPAPETSGAPPAVGSRRSRSGRGDGADAPGTPTSAPRD
jgi:hypothetical protein